MIRIKVKKLLGGETKTIKPKYHKSRLYELTTKTFMNALEAMNYTLLELSDMSATQTMSREEEANMLEQIQDLTTSFEEMLTHIAHPENYTGCLILAFQQGADLTPFGNSLLKKYGDAKLKTEAN